MSLCEDLQWAGLQWDEGPLVGGPYGPYRQSERTHIYHEHAQRLLDAGSAYRCFCRPQSSGGGPETVYVTSGCYQNCSSLSSEVSRQRAESGKEAFTVRLHQSADVQKRVYPDLVYGKIQRLKRSPAAPQIASEDDAGIDAADTILMKSDGTPTYHFANVVDDHLMKITHVIRGLEWMASTPLHYDIYSAFGWEPPQFAHVGLLVDQNKAKLSKRNQDLALDVASMRDVHGVLPDTLNNFLALLGWSNPTDNDVMDLDALVRNIDLKFTRGNTMVRVEKLWYLQKQHVALRCQRALDTKSLEPIKDIVSQITAEVRGAYPDHITNLENEEAVPEDFKEGHHDVSDAQTSYWATILLADSKSFQNAKQFVDRNRYFISRERYQVPEEKRFYNKGATITPLRLKFAVNAVIVDYNAMNDAAILAEEQNVQGLSKAKVQSRNDVQPFKESDKEEIFHVLLARQAWHAALYEDIPFDLPDLTIEYTGDLTPKLTDHWGFEPSDIEAIARRLYLEHATRSAISDGGPVAIQAMKWSEEWVGGGRECVIDDAGEAAIQALATRYRIFYAALMKYLRAKLCGGLPGPSVSSVMAILGGWECLQRIGPDVPGGIVILKGSAIVG